MTVTNSEHLMAGLNAAQQKRLIMECLDDPQIHLGTEVQLQKFMRMVSIFIEKDAHFQQLNSQFRPQLTSAKD